MKSSGFCHRNDPPSIISLCNVEATGLFNAPNCEKPDFLSTEYRKYFYSNNLYHDKKLIVNVNMLLVGIVVT